MDFCRRRCCQALAPLEPPRLVPAQAAFFEARAGSIKYTIP